MAERMNNPAMIIPEAMEAIQAFQEATYQGGVFSTPDRTARQVGPSMSTKVTLWMRLG